MEKKGVLIPLILAVLAASLYFAALASRESALARGYDLVDVLVARQDIPERTVLNEGLVDKMRMPRKFMAVDAFEIKIPSDVKLVNNLVTRVRVPRGNQIVQSDLVSLSPDAGLSTKVHPGYRGAIVMVDNELMQLIKPGDRVDVLVTFEASISGHKEKVTATILQNVHVLAVGENLGQGMTAKQFQQTSAASAQAAAFSEKGVLSLELNPQEAQYLALAANQGVVSVALRGLGDLEMHPIEMASFQKLFR